MDTIQRKYIPELYRLQNLPLEKPKNPVTILESQVFNTLEEATIWANQFYPKWVAADPAFRGCALLRVIKDGANNGVYLVNPGETAPVYTGGTGVSIDEHNKINFNAGENLTVDEENKVNADARRVEAGSGIEIDEEGKVNVKLSENGNVDLSFDNGAVRADMFYRHDGELQDKVANDVGGVYEGTAYEDLIGPHGEKKDLNQLLDKILFTKRHTIILTEVYDTTNHQFTAHSEYEEGTSALIEKGWLLATNPSFEGGERFVDTTEDFTHTFENLNPGTEEQDDIYYVRSYIKSEAGIHFGEIKKVTLGFMFTGIIEDEFDCYHPEGIVPIITDKEEWTYTTNEHHKSNPVKVAGEPGIGTYGRLFVMVPKSLKINVFCPNQPDFKFIHSDDVEDNEIFEVEYDNVIYTLYITNTVSYYENDGENMVNEFQIYIK